MGCAPALRQAESLPIIVRYEAETHVTSGTYSFTLWNTGLPAHLILVCCLKRIDDCDAAYSCNRTAKSDKLVTAYLIGPAEVIQNFGNRLSSDRMSNVVG